MIKPVKKRVLSTGGPERIRTAVEAFAELCLATRPQDLLFGHAVFFCKHLF